MVHALLLLLDEAPDSIELYLLLLDCVRELKHVGEVVELDLAIEDAPRLPDQILQPLILLYDFLASERLNELLHRDVLRRLVIVDHLLGLIRRDAQARVLHLGDLVEQVLEVKLDFLVVPLQLTIDQLLVVEEDLSQEQVAQQKDADQQK